MRYPLETTLYSVHCTIAILLRLTSVLQCYQYWYWRWGKYTCYLLPSILESKHQHCFKACPQKGSFNYPTQLYQVHCAFMVISPPRPHVIAPGIELIINLLVSLNTIEAHVKNTTIILKQQQTARINLHMITSLSHITTLSKYREIIEESYMQW